MLRIRLTVSNQFELVPTEYTLIDDKYQGFTNDVKSKKFYFNANYLKGTFTGSWGICGVYVRRKFDMRDCADNAITTIKVGRGGEFFDVKNLDTLTAANKYYICQEKRYLTTIKQNNPELYQQGKKRRFPSYLFVNNLNELKQTVHFELTWGDNYSQTLLHQVGKTIDMEFNIYTDDNE
jgi:hypothetical protein